MKITNFIKLTDENKTKFIKQNFDLYVLNELQNFYKYINNDEYKCNLLLSLLDKISVKKLYLFLDYIYSQKELVKFFINYNTIKKDYISDYVIEYICKYIKDDIHKIVILKQIKVKNYQYITVFSSFYNKKLLVNLSKDIKYHYIKKELVILSEDIKCIIDYFSSIKDLNEKLAFINEVHNENIKNYLISKIHNRLYQKFQYNQKSLNEKNISINEDLVDSNISIGLELEVQNSFIKYFNSLLQTFENYFVTYDISVKKGIEIVSPILRFTNNDLNKLYNICQILNECNFFTSKSCGGHIHIGANYFDSQEDYKNLLKLVLCIEKILYAISNKKGTKTRKGYINYAMPISNVLLHDKYIFDKQMSDENFIKYLKKIIGSRYASVNFQNIGKINKNTIEFRMPNCEIDYYELYANIVLFAKLVEVSHNLSNPSFNKNIYFNNILSNSLNEEKFINLMYLLFDDFMDMKIYIDRFYTNFDIEKEKVLVLE